MKPVEVPDENEFLQNGTAGIPKSLSAAARLRRLLAQDGKTIVAPGVYDGLTARITLNEGFDALYMTGAGTAISRLGMPDLGMTNLNDMVDNAAMIASLDRTVPLLADADAGYGGPLMVARTVRAYINAGVAGMHLEDQVIAKRCGHLANKELVSEQVFIARIRAAALAREELKTACGGDIVLIARTDSLQSLGYEAAVTRLKKAVSAGADVAFLEGMTTVKQCQKVCADLAPTPCLLNMVSGGVTPDLSAAEANEMGFKIVIFPLVSLGPAHEEITKHVRQFKKLQRNHVSEQQKAKGGVYELFNACKMADYVAFDKEVGGSSYNDGV